MDRREFLKISSTCIAGLMVGCGGMQERTPSLLNQLTNREYDYNSILLEITGNLNIILNYSYRVSLQHLYRVNDTDYLHRSTTFEGTAFPIGIKDNRPLFLTAAHVLVANPEEEIRNGSHDILGGLRNEYGSRLSRNQ